MVMRIDFYHLITKQPEQVLVNLAERSLPLGKVLMCVSDKEQADYFDKFLWTFNEQSWFPHAVAGSSDDILQPFLITTNALLNSNNASFLFVYGGAHIDIDTLLSDNKFERVLIIFTDNDVVAKDYARTLWMTASESGCERNYWKL